LIFLFIDKLDAVDAWFGFVRYTYRLKQKKTESKLKAFSLRPYLAGSLGKPYAIYSADCGAKIIIRVEMTNFLKG